MKKKLALWITTWAALTLLIGVSAWAPFAFGFDPKFMAFVIVAGLGIGLIGLLLADMFSVIDITR